MMRDLQNALDQVEDTSVAMYPTFFHQHAFHLVSYISMLNTVTYFLLLGAFIYLNICYFLFLYKSINNVFN